MGRYDHPCYHNRDRVPRSRHHHNARAQASPVSATEVDAATQSRAARSPSPERAAHHRNGFAVRMTVAFLGLFVVLAVATSSCDPQSSVFCAEAFCDPLVVGP